MKKIFIIIFIVLIPYISFSASSFTFTLSKKTYDNVTGFLPFSGVYYVKFISSDSSTHCSKILFYNFVIKRFYHTDEGYNPISLFRLDNYTSFSFSPSFSDAVDKDCPSCTGYPPDNSFYSVSVSSDNSSYYLSFSKYSPITSYLASYSYSSASLCSSDDDLSSDVVSCPSPPSSQIVYLGDKYSGRPSSCPDTPPCAPNDNLSCDNGERYYSWPPSYASDGSSTYMTNPGFVFVDTQYDVISNDNNSYYCRNSGKSFQIVVTCPGYNLTTMNAHSFCVLSVAKYCYSLPSNSPCRKANFIYNVSVSPSGAVFTPSSNSVDVTKSICYLLDYSFDKHSTFNAFFNHYDKPSHSLSFFQAANEYNQRQILSNLKNINDSLSPSSSPSVVLNFDTVVSSPSKHNLSSLFDTFLSNSPFSFENSNLSLADSYCSLSSSLFGHSFSVSFCDSSTISFLNLVGSFLVVVASLFFFFIVFRG